MKISKQSWHYKLINKVGIVYPYNRNNLCAYVRGLVITILISAWMIISPFISGYYIINGLPESLTVVDLLIIITTGVASGLWLIISLLHIIEILRYNISLPHLSFPNFSNNIIIEYIKAKKKKICPIIEFVEE